MKKFLEAKQKAAQKAAHDTARIMTSQLRQHALESGWDADVVNNLSVINKNGKFTTDIHPSYANRAFTHEYGDEHNRPTATIRKYLNDPVHTNNAFMVALEHHWKKA